MLYPIQPEDDPLFPRFMEEFSALVQSGKRVVLNMDAWEAYCLLASVQLALRHPQFEGTTSDIARKIAETIGESLIDDPGGALAETIERGWQKERVTGVCRVCGCTDDRECPGGCYWVEADLCSRCS